MSLNFTLNVFTGHDKARIIQFHSNSEVNFMQGRMGILKISSLSNSSCWLELLCKIALAYMGVFCNGIKTEIIEANVDCLALIISLTWSVT